MKIFAFSSYHLQNFRFSVVEFKDKESAKKCVENMHRMQMKDRYVVVKEIRVTKKKIFVRKAIFILIIVMVVI